MNSSNLYLYMAGDNNLDIAARKDIAEDLLGTPISKRTTVYVQFDRRAPLPWETDLNEFKTQRFLLKEGSKKHLKTLDETNSGDYTVLSEFLNECIEHSDANYHFAIVWGHGGGLKAKYDFKDESYKWVGIDNDSMDALSIPELAKSFSSTNIYFDIIGFDACLMSVLELAYELRNNGRFMLASQAIEPPDGWNYNDILHKIDNEFETLSKVLLKKLTRSYLHSYENTNKSITLSTTDLSKIDEVAKLRDEFSQLLMEHIELIKSSQIMRKVQRFEDRNYVDLKHFVTLCLQSIPTQKLKEKGEELIELLSKVIVANVKKGELYRNAHGISVLLPVSLEHPLPFDLEIHKNYPNWLKLVKKLLI